MVKVRVRVSVMVRVMVRIMVMVMVGIRVRPRVPCKGTHPILATAPGHSPDPEPNPQAPILVSLPCR